MSETMKDIKRLGYTFILVIMVLKIVFYNTNILTLGRMSIGIFWLFVLPGFSIMELWRNSFDFIERIIAGTVLGIAIVGLLSYNATLINISIHIQYIILPIIVIGVGFILSKKCKKSSSKSLGKEHST